MSGAVALLLDSRPDLTPDQVKALLRQSAESMPAADAAGRGAGELDVYRAFQAAAARTTQSWTRSSGLGSLESARGTQHVADEGVELTGEQQVLGPFDARRWAPASAAFTAWNGGTWAGGELDRGLLVRGRVVGQVVVGQVVVGQVVVRRRLVGQVVVGQVVVRRRLVGQVVVRLGVDRQVVVGNVLVMT